MLKTSPQRQPIPETPGYTPNGNGRRPGRPPRPLGELIVERGLATPARMEEMVARATEAGRPLEELLLEAGVVTGDELARALADRYGLPLVDLGAFPVEPEAANLLPPQKARDYRAIPIAFVEEATLLVAMANPTNVLALDDIQLATGHRCQPAVAAREDIEELIQRLLNAQAAESLARDSAGAERDTGLADVIQLHESAEDAPVVKLVHGIVADAVARGASDIHFEAGADEMRVRFRIDGILLHATSVASSLRFGVISRLKIMSGIDIGERRVPQDGRVTMSIDGKAVDLRVATLPTAWGEDCALRILDRESMGLAIERLGIEGEVRRRFEASFTKAQGAVIVTGPTGSGKSTTLYAALNALNQVDRNIVTIEDPVEYRLAGLKQIQVNEKAGLTFATGLRSILRSDPDVIMVGEIRDAETARIAIESAVTGHMVLSTLHTRDAPGVIERLTELGIEPFILASALDCVIAQRLARSLCPHCKRRVDHPPEALERSGFRAGEALAAYEPTGCGRCGGNGYKGRVGLYEVMLFSPEIRSMAAAGASGETIGDLATEQGMRSLRDDGLEKVRQGLTSLDEVARVTT